MKILILFLLTSCSLFKTHTVNRELHKSTQNIFLSSEGKGRLFVQNSKYVFSYESALDEEHAHWQLVLNFPLRKPETFKLDWSEEGKVKFKSSIEERLLKENRNINPRSLERFTKGLGELLQEVIEVRSLKRNGKKKFIWKRTPKALKAKDKSGRFNAMFTNLVSDSHFGLMRVNYQNSKKQAYKMDLVVRKCLE